MMHHAQGTLKTLIDALKVLPGVGPKSAERMAYHILQHQRQGGERLAAALSAALTLLNPCERCNNYTELPICERCQSDKRDASQLCVVETPVDMNRVEQTHAFHGMYFVLMGRLSPLDGMGPEHIGIDALMRRCADPALSEVILATNVTNEGEATAHYIQHMLTARGLKVSRIARGVPVGGELEFVDGGTLAQALRERRPMDTL